jgi:hypothetical protein
MAQTLVDGCRGDARLFHQPAGCGDGMFQKRPMDMKRRQYLSFSKEDQTSFKKPSKIQKIVQRGPAKV